MVIDRGFPDKARRGWYAGRSIVVDLAPLAGASAVDGGGTGAAAGSIDTDDPPRHGGPERGGSAGRGRAGDGWGLASAGGVSHEPDRSQRYRGAGPVPGDSDARLRRPGA